MTQQIVLGTMNFGTTTSPETSYALLDRFVQLGGTWLDTADCYAFWNDPAGQGGASERTLGAWLRARDARDQVKLSTKLRYLPVGEGTWPENAAGLSRAAISSAAAGSLDRLGVERVDLLWAHGPDPTVPLEEVVEGLAALVGNGVDAVGAANHPTWLVERARGLAASRDLPGFAALQLRHSLVQPRPQAALPDQGHVLLTEEAREYAVAEQMPTWVYTPLLNGGYTRADKAFPEAYDHPGTTRVLAALDEVAAETGATRNQVVLSYLHGPYPHGHGLTPIVGVSTVEQLDEAMAARDLRLDDDQFRRLNEAR